MSQEAKFAECIPSYNWNINYKAEYIEHEMLQPIKAIELVAQQVIFFSVAREVTACVRS